MSGSFDEAYYTKFVEDYVSQKKLLSQLETKIEKMKKELSNIVDTLGTADDSGHIWLNIGGHELKRERRVSKSFNSSEAETWAKENGVWDDVKEVIERISEDKLLGLAWNDKSLLPTIQGFYTEKEIWAFKA
jgi:hypothetical protein